MGIAKRYMPEDSTSFMPPATNFAILDSQKVQVVPLTAAQLIAMGTTPVSILSAPGAGKAIMVDSIALDFTPGGSAFTSGGAINFQYHTTTSSVPHAGTIPASFLTSSVSQAINRLGPNVGSNGMTLPINEGIDITNATAPFASGNGTAKVIIRFRVITA